MCKNKGKSEFGGECGGGIQKWWRIRIIGGIKGGGAPRGGKLWREFLTGIRRGNLWGALKRDQQIGK